MMKWDLSKDRTSNKPAMTLSDFADAKNLNPRSLAAAVGADKNIPHSIYIKKKKYYHVDELNTWLSNNVDKVKTL